MDWNQARAQIKIHIVIGTDLNTPRSHHRIVRAVNENGILVPVGQNAEITVSWEMLKNCFAALNNRGYNGVSFRDQYQDRARNHPCYIHVVGMIFVRSELANMPQDGMYHPIV
mgnify:CR=1 FL=1